MRLKRQMTESRRIWIEKKIEALSAQIELADHNVRHFGRKIDDQQALVTQIGEEQDEEDEACEDLQLQLQQMKKGKKEQEEWLKTFWKSNVLNETPGTRKNLLKRRKLCGRRPRFGSLDLPIGPGTEESRREEEEQKQQQEEVEETLYIRQEREQELLEEYQEEEITLQCIQKIFFEDHSPQLEGLIKSRDREFLRREMMDNY